MLRWIFVNLLVISAISPQPISDHEGRECCPCPKPGPAPDITFSLPDSDLTAGFPRSDFTAEFARSDLDDCPCARANQDRFEGADQDLAGTTGEGSFVRASAVDDCPCRLRDADSVGAPSVFFPAAVRALRPLVSNKETKEDAKPLLHPEVGLASSVLETLREATDEEYQEALARDAVRSVLQAPDVDVVSDVSSALDTARNIVNVLLKPNDSVENRDDTQSEASHVQESRCIHPLGRANSLNLEYSPTSVNEITMPSKEPITLLHKNRNIWDLDSSVGASDAHEQIIDGTGHGLEGLKLKSNPSLFNLFPDKNNAETDRQFKLKPLKENKKILVNLKETGKTENPLDALNRKIDDSLSDLKIKLDNHLQTIKNDNTEKFKSVFDNVNSPSINNFEFKPFVPTKKLEYTTIKPLPLKTLLNLKDVELVPPVKTLTNDFNKARSNIPELIPKNKDSGTDLFKNFKTVDLGDLITKGLKIGFQNSNNKEGTDNIQPIPKGIFRSGIVDVETSPSEVKLNVHSVAKDNKDCDNNNESNSLLPAQSKIVPEARNTEILEVLPKPLNKLHNENVPSAHIDETTDDAETLNNNINDLPQNVNNMPNTEIIDTIPSPSHTHSTNFEEESINDNIDDSNEVLRNDSGCETDNSDIRDNDSSFVNDSMENNHDNIDDDENIDDIDISQESDMKQRQQDTGENCVESIKQRDFVPETSNVLPNTVELEDQRVDKSPSSTNNSEEACDTANFDEFERVKQETENDVADTNPVFKKGTLSSLKEDIIRKLDKLKKPKHKIIIEKNNKIDDNKEVKCEEEENVVSKTAKDLDTEKIPSKELDIEDLQKMSDKLLDLSAKKDQESFASENVQCSNLPNSETVSDEIQDSTNEKVDDNPLGDITAESSQKVDSTEDDDSIPETSNIANNINSSDENLERKNTCLSDFKQKSNTVSEENMRNEMATDGSDPVVEKMAPEMLNRPSLLRDILHPRPVSIGSNLKLPSLDDVRDNLVSILEPKGNIGVSNIEDENLSDNSNIMSVDASAPTFQSTLPLLQPLEDINLDIFQLRPLTLPDPQDLFSQVPSFPRLNLNSYKSKLAVPKGLNLKPMKLESSLGGKNGLFGATLTIGSDKGSLGKGPKLLGGPFSLSNLPTLEELHSNLRENAQNLLSTPLDITGRNIIDDSLRSSQTLTDNLRSQAKNTMKDIEQTLQTRLKDKQQSDLGVLADPLKDPQEFFQAVSRTHEDVTDKLKAIHYDLNDRLESIRDRITDQSLLPTFNSPNMRQSSSAFRSEKPSLSTPYRKPQKKLKASSKSRPQSSSRVSLSRPKSAKTKTLKMPAAHSVPVPKTVEAPKLKAIASSSPPPFVLKTPSFRTSQLLTNKKSITDILPEPVSRYRDSKIPVFGKLKSTENRVKISFGTTTLRPDLSRNKPILSTRLNDRPIVSRKPTFSSKITSPANSGSSRFGSKLRPLSDANVAPSETVPKKLKTPMKVEEINKPVISLPTKKLSELPKPKSLLNKPKPHINDRFTNGHSSGPVFDSSMDKSMIGSQGESPVETKLGSPKNLDILASLREAVRARLSNLTPITNDKIVQPDSSIQQSDMLRSASKNVESTDVGGLMRENTSYTCKIICTRNN